MGCGEGGWKRRGRGKGIGCKEEEKDGVGEEVREGEVG